MTQSTALNSRCYTVEQGRLAKLNVPSNTSLAVSFWEHTIPCRFCSDISVLVRCFHMDLATPVQRN